MMDLVMSVLRGVLDTSCFIVQILCSCLPCTPDFPIRRHSLPWSSTMKESRLGIVVMALVPVICIALMWFLTTD